jgi:ABC-2 type transport system permease protein
MRTIFVLLSREIRSFFNTPVAYVVIVFFLVVLGFQFSAGVIAINNHPESTATPLQACFDLVFWFAFVLSISLISMRSFADEFRMGTLETLTTAPVRDWQVVLAKFGGVFIFYLTMLAPTGLFFVILRQFNDGSLGTTTPGVYGATYLVLALVGLLYVSIGCFASSLVKDQINGAIITFAAIFVTFFLALFLANQEMVKSPAVRALGLYFSPYHHVHDACLGKISTQLFVYYLSLTGLFLFCTLQVFQFRKWRA